MKRLAILTPNESVLLENLFHGVKIKRRHKNSSSLSSATYRSLIWRQKISGSRCFLSSFTISIACSRFGAMPSSTNSCAVLSYTNLLADTRLAVLNSIQSSLSCSNPILTAVNSLNQQKKCIMSILDMILIPSKIFSNWYDLY